MITRLKTLKPVVQCRLQDQPAKATVPDQAAAPAHTNGARSLHAAADAAKGTNLGTTAKGYANPTGSPAAVDQPVRCLANQETR